MKCPNCKTETDVLYSDGIEFYRCRTCPFGTPVESSQKVCHEIFAFLSDDGRGGEGLIGLEINGVMMSAVCTDRKMLETLWPSVLQVRDSGLKVTLARFSSREDLEQR